MKPTLRRRLRSTLLLALVLAVVALAVAGAVAHRYGWRLHLARVAPEAAPGPPLDFTARPGGDRLENGFPPGARPKNVVLIVGDGMGFNQVFASRAETVGVENRLFMERLPVVGWVTTHSLDDLHTDSAAAATSLAAGIKTGVGMLGRTPDGRAVPTVLEAGLARGMRAGLLTTSTIFDATPAAFVVHVDTRRDYDAVAEQMAASGVELLVSEAPATDTGTRRRWLAEERERFEGAGYRWLDRWADLAAAPGGPPGKTIALLPRGTLATPARQVPLADVAALALTRFAGSPGGFFLLVEDEDPDTGGHRSDLPRVVAAVAALDGVTERAVEFARADGATLVLVAADHETGGLTLLGGRAGEPLDYLWASGAEHTALPVPLFAFGPGAERFAGVLDDTEVPRILADLLGLELAGR